MGEYITYKHILDGICLLEINNSRNWAEQPIYIWLTNCYDWSFLY